MTDVSLSRRALLRMAGAGATAAMVTTASGARVAFGAPRGGDVLVVLSLRGGFDGLTAVPPVGDPGYARLRPTIGVPSGDALRVDRLFGLHPALGALERRWDDETLAVVHAVGFGGSRSHAVARAEVERAAPGPEPTGWIDRVLAGGRDAGPYAVAQVGEPTVPAAAAGGGAFAVHRLATLGLVVKADDVPLTAWRDAFATLAEGSDAAAPTLAALGGVADLGRLAPPARDADDEPEAVTAGYPPGELGEALHDVALIVRADAGLRVATVDAGGWDLHAGAGAPGDGPMHDRLGELGRALAAFADELRDDYGRVTLVTVSEFGRRADENGSGGTDHGRATAVLVLGGPVRGGRVLGRWPGLGTDRFTSGDLAATTDYRSVLAEVLANRLGVTDTGRVFPGARTPPLRLVRER